MVGYGPTMALTGNGELGFDSGEGATSLSGTLLTGSQPNISSVNVLNISQHDGSTKGLSLGGVLVQVSASEFNYLNVAAGTAAASCALVLDPSRNITNINSLTSTTLACTNLSQASVSYNLANMYSTSTSSITLSGTLSAATLTGTLSTASQPNITSVGTLSSLTCSGSMSLNGTSSALSVAGASAYINANAYRQGGTQYDISLVSYLSSLTAGTATASKALVLDSSRNITNINSLTATTLVGTLSTAAQANITSVGTLLSLSVSGSINCPTYKQSGTTYDLSTFITSSALSSYYSTATTSITLSGTLMATTLTGTLSTVSQPNITSLGTLTGLSISGTGCQFNALAGNTSVSSLAAGSHGLFIRGNSIGLYTYSGLAFLLDTDTNYSTTTPSASISCLRRSGTAYDGADIEFWSKTTATQTGSLFRFGAFHGTGTGQLSVGPTNGAMDLNVLKLAGPSFRIGSYESASNCFTMTYSYTSYGSTSNCLHFDNYGVSGNLSLFASNNVAIGTTTNPVSKFQVVGNTSNSYGSWDRVQRWTNDQSTPLAVEMLVYNQLGGSNDSTNGGACIGTMTNDPFKIFTSGSNIAIFNTSGRFMVGSGINMSPEATIHSGGDVWANGLFYTKDNVDGKAKYRFNWSQTNYAAMGTDSTVGAMRLGTCDANYAWVSYIPVRGGAYTNASDRRLKTNIIDVPYGLADVLRMKPRKFTMAQEQTEHVGFIAQELFSIIPEAVEQGANDDLNPDGFPINPWGIDLASLTSVLCRAIQQQQEQIDDLKKLLTPQ
ncbi:hypothetical protein ON010_g7542 [Phytophthora cinnamomi]|nr:hypothetical protein ON010_g7542 [Phytophthora cinnamomi]